MRRTPIDRLFALTVVLLGFLLGARPVSDNSAFVHLRTGIDIVNGHGIPRGDPYSFTANGADWVVQSWLPSLMYGLAFKVDGGVYVLFQGAMTAAIAVSLVALVRPAGTPLRRVGVALLAISLAGLAWSPRPLLFGLLCLGLTLLSVERDWPWWTHLVIGWVWVNSHGSFPLGVAWIVASAIGSTIDERRLFTDRTLRIVPVVGGMLLGAVNPLGPRLLLFPLAVGDRREVFSRIVEWRSPNFQSLAGLLAAAGIATSIVVLSRRRIPWRLLLPVAAFLIAALYASRNLAPLAIVLAPALAAAAAVNALPSPEADRIRSAWASRERVAAGFLGACLVVFGSVAWAGPAVASSAYPEDVVDRATEAGWLRPGRPVAHSDVVGCYLILLRGRGAGVFIDDRYDMYSAGMSQDYIALVDVEADALSVLDRRGIDVVLWRRSLGLVALLGEAGWKEVEGDRTWVVLARPGARA